MNFRLEYTCSESELAEAQALLTQHQTGGRPKWRRFIDSYGFAVLLLGVYIAMAAPADRFLIVVSFGVVVMGVLIYFAYQRLKHKEQPSRIILEVSEPGLAIHTKYGDVTRSWSAFSLCLESATVFALINQGKTLVYTVPKRAFPDEESQAWFRAIHQRSEGVAMSSGAEKTGGKAFPANKVNLTVQLRYSDYLNLALASWAGRVFCLAMTALGFMVWFISAKPADSGHLRDRASILPLSLAAAGLGIIFLFNLLQSWRLDKTRRNYPMRLSLSNEGIEFANQNSAGKLLWPACKYYLENRWAFFIWNPPASVILTLPKHAFASPLEVTQCREMLRANLVSRRWFYR